MKHFFLNHSLYIISKQRIHQKSITSFKLRFNTKSFTSQILTFSSQTRFLVSKTIFSDRKKMDFTQKMS